MSRAAERRVALVTLAWHGHGGIERCVAAEAEHLARRGAEVHVFAATFEGAAPAGVYFHRVALPRLPWALKLAVFAWAAPRAVTRLQPFDAVHAHTVYLGASDLASAHSVHRVAVAVDPPATGWARVIAWLKGLPPLSVWLSDQTYLRARKRHAISNSVAAELRACYGPGAEALEVIYCGVDQRKFKALSASRRKALRRSLQLGSSAWAVFCGWNWRRKGLDVALQAMVKVPKARLLVVGEDPLEGGRFRSMAGEMGLGQRVRFVGRQADPSPWFMAADLFVFPTRYEPFGMVISEAMACGLPVLVPSGAGASEVIRQGRAQQVLEGGSAPAAWAAAWQAMLDDAPLRARLGRANAAAAAGLTWQRFGRQLEAALGLQKAAR